MGSRGPIPITAGTLGARGSTAAKQRARRERAAAQEPAQPVCPSWLGADERVVWRRVVSGLRPFGILRPVDAMELGRYCDLWVLWETLTKARDAVPYGEPECVRLERRALKVSAMLLTLEDRFGMNPASRARLGLPLEAQPPQTDSLLRYRLDKLLPNRSGAN